MNVKKTSNHNKIYSYSVDTNAGRLIRQLRKESGMSGEILGRLTGLSQQQVSCYERGESEFTLEKLQKFAAIFEMNIWQFMRELNFLLHQENKEKSGSFHDVP